MLGLINPTVGAMIHLVAEVAGEGELFIYREPLWWF